MSDTKREEIKARIAAAEAREDAAAEKSLTVRAQETASQAGETFTTFVKERPLIAAAGGVALGVLIASMFKGPRRAAKAGSARAVGLATVGAEIASGFATQMASDAMGLGREGARKAEDIGDAASDKARAIGRSAAHRLGDASDAARIARRETGKAIARAMGRR